MTVWLVLERHNISFSKITFFSLEIFVRVCYDFGKPLFCPTELGRNLFPFLTIEKVDKVSAYNGRWIGILPTYEIVLQRIIWELL